MTLRLGDTIIAGSGANQDLSNLTSQGKSYASGLGMPSSRYIDLTLLASGATYTAPANGYLFLSKDAGSDWYYCNIVNTSMNLGCFQSEYRTSPNTCCMPAKKGDIIRVDYNATGATRYFRFIYAEGEN